MDWKTLEEAIEIINSQIPCISGRDIEIKASVGCISRENIYAKIDQPPFPRSPLDGYALRAEDTQQASQAKPVQLKLTGSSLAGNPCGAYVRSGYGVKISTGGVLPKGANCVVKQEEVTKSGNIINVYRQLEPYENYCCRGEDYKKGYLLLKKGMKIDAAAAAVLASSGFTKIKCVPKAKAAIISTGDELRQPGKLLTEGCIYDANEYYLYARLKELGIESVCLKPVKDRTEEIASGIEEGISKADLLITTGGISVGEKDLVPQTLQKLGAKLVFQGIKIKPGMPTMIALLKDRTVLSLSGNPFAAAVAFEMLIKHILNKLNGGEIMKTCRTEAILANNFNKKSPLRRFIRGKYNDGTVMVPCAQGNGQLSSMVGCNCLVDIPAGSGAKKAGEIVTVQIL